jgi:hypothetical protein
VVTRVLRAVEVRMGDTVILSDRPRMVMQSRQGSGGMIVLDFGTVQLIAPPSAPLIVSRSVRVERDDVPVVVWSAG